MFCKYSCFSGILPLLEKLLTKLKNDHHNAPTGHNLPSETIPEFDDLASIHLIVNMFIDRKRKQIHIIIKLTELKKKRGSKS